MPRVPAMRRKMVRGKEVAVVTLLDGATGKRRDYWLGTWGTDEARRLYDRTVADWIAAGRRATLPYAGGLIVAELVDRFAAWAEGYYSAGEYGTLRSAWGPLVETFAALPAVEFSPMRLRAVRTEMIRRGWCRKFINHQVRRVVSIWRWAVGQELVAAEVWEALRAVEPLREGRTVARETAAVAPVLDATVEATLPWLSRPVRALVQLQRLTGARGDELFRLRRCDVVMDGDVWRTKVEKHKTAHRGKSRTLYFGPQSQAILAPLLLRPDEAFLFDTPRGHYTRQSYARAITRAADRADHWAHGGRVAADEDRLVPHWHPHQLRHTAATEIRREFGLEAAAAVLGHSSPIITDAVYAERSRKTVEDVMRRLG